MRRSRCARRQVVVVPYLERVVVFLDLFLVEWVVAGDVSDILSVWSPGKLLNPVGRIGNFLRVTTAHRHDENLRGVSPFFGVVFLFLSVRYHRNKFLPIAAGGPSRRPHPLTIEGQHSLGTGSHV